MTQSQTLPVALVAHTLECQLSRLLFALGLQSLLHICHSARRCVSIIHLHQHHIHIRRYSVLPTALYPELLQCIPQAVVLLGVVVFLVPRGVQLFLNGL
jgi:hypothetical protein